MQQHADLFKRAQQHIPGGVNSPVRSFRGVEGTPIFLKSASGAYVVDIHDKHYIDFVGSWGPMILGHNHPRVVEAIKRQAEQGISFGACHSLEIEMAEKVSALMPNIEMLRMVNSGTEATMSAIRLARAFTGRDKIVKFSGCYHGHSDSLLVAAGSGVLTFGIPSCPGVPKNFAEHTLTAEFNNLLQVEALFAAEGNNIAAIIVEPIPGNMGCLLPQANFLQSLRTLCDHYGSLLIFDEVMTGFRVHMGGATALYEVSPDLITLGKIIGGGLPVGAFGGRKDIMMQLAPAGAVYQAGTLSGNPLALAAGLATLEEISQPSFHRMLADTTQQFVIGLKERATRFDIPLVINATCGMFSLFFTEAEQVSSYEQVMQCDTGRFKQFFHHMLKEGIYLAPSAFEASFVSSSHQEEEIALTLNAAEKAFTQLATVVS